MEILSPLQKEILSGFADIPESDLFYLTGGTALAAFYLLHRKSNDLDFFTTKEDIILPFSFRLENRLQEKGTATERSRSLHSFVELLIKKREELTIIHLGQDTPFRLEPVRTIPQFPGVKIDSLTDIASNKLLALFQRATLRDFIDIYFLVKEKYFSPDQLMKLAKQKDPGFDLYWLGVALERINLFPNDAPEMLLMVKPCTLDELATFFNNWRKDIAKELAK